MPRRTLGKRAVPDENKKTAVYVDGYNLYYGRLRNSAYKWLDVVALFDGLLKVKPACASCGLDYSFADSGDGPVVFVLLIVGFIVVCALVDFVGRHGFAPFAWWRIVVGIGGLVWLGLAAH